ncbi:hypothetical protein HHI36_017317 [Cryptolaemus montrouzieri]|uniref:Uncharacterized protein n=1 Tax=Cryptolaemus montrouzieri TaxID=559131 RepID=A0ABD2NMK8_9CUCU
MEIDVMPCTQAVNAASMSTAERLLRDSTPPSYRLLQAEPLSQTGRNPHRWLGCFERIDNVYDHTCDYLPSVRTNLFCRVSNKPSR